MKKQFVSLIKFVSASNGGDFNGLKSTLSVKDQINYLRHFYDVFSKEIDFSPNSYVFGEKEVNNIINSLPTPDFSFRNRNEIVKWNFHRENLNEYKNIRLYTDNATIRNGGVYLKHKPTTPYAAFELETKNVFDSIRFDLAIDKDFYLPIRCKVDTMVPARTIEFKNGITEILKIGIYSDGKIYARILKGDLYHHENIFVSEYAFGKPNNIEFAFAKDSIIVRMGECEKVIENVNTLLPNTMFAGSGLHSFGDWSFENLEVKENNKQISIFDKNKELTKEDAVDVLLPKAIGGFENRNYSAVFEANFDISSLDKKTLLHISELTPSGKIYINDKLLLNKDNPSEINKEISDFVKEGSNSIKVVVDARAPENIVPWHRNKDPYFGLSFDSVYVEQVNKTYIEKVNIVTISTTDKIEAKLLPTINCGEDAKLELEIYSLNNQLVFNKKFDSLNDLHFQFNGEKWNFYNPCLYKIRLSLFKNDQKIDQYETIYGFRTIEQSNGSIQLNGKEVNLNGALLMQYLYPVNEIVNNHIYSSFDQVVKQCLTAKKMNCTCIRMHQLGYGSNDKRIAAVCDYLGLGLVWTTRYEESIYNSLYTKTYWENEEYFINEINEIINNPSILIYEGSNELYLYREDIDIIYKNFVNAVRKVDTTRLICPVSHLYYGNDSYDRKCQYYQDDGCKDEFFNVCESCKEWNDTLVVRSSHTYNWLLGYGSTWDSLRLQNWSAQDSLLNSKDHAYLITEYAIIGKQSPSSDNKKIVVNNNSYELGDETSLGYEFDNNHWFLSQAYQALCATFATRKMLAMGVDGMMWCSLIGGANDTTYLKPVVDFYYRPKLAYYALQNCFDKVSAFQDDVDIVWGKDHKIKPIVMNNSDPITKDVLVEIFDETNNCAFSYLYEKVKLNKKINKLPPVVLPNLADGFYKYYISII